ncbi:pseudaminic acid synthase [Pseudodesulfovibrio thermohalotolerans]|uniref:pseudaminic acid synthase n=1 Tax=Pseudodesulfovibrio thermohalotolerans TaxID=2880651 RepID=UPI00244282BB|nr:pseudaminic acid synthase [Pseudodesulfovibrio thermohalotolerans]WFS61217.1 pseudaminic acid synthase [Pseudodesulfovibrio thermohalotolerans]
MKNTIRIGDRLIGEGQPAYIIAEMSANHGHDFDQALRIIEAAHKAGADAVKLQTYTPDTMTIDCDNEWFRIHGTIWEGKNLHSLYGEAFTPWEWQPKLKEYAESLGMDCFSSPFDFTSVDFLEEMGVVAYKVASFEIVDIPLLEKIASTGKPVIVSTGMASLSEIDEAVRTLRANGATDIALLKCTSAYPASPEEANLRTIPHLAKSFGLPAGLSDHTMGNGVAIAGVALGACIVEKHFTIDRSQGGPDSAFSMEPDEFASMVADIRMAEKALGEVSYEITRKQKDSKVFRRSLFVVEDIKAGEELTERNVRSIRPGYGLHTRYLKVVLGKKAVVDIPRGTPLGWDKIG